MNRFVKAMLAKAGGMYEAWQEKRLAEVQFPAGVEEFRDIPYIHDGKRCHLMDVYRPAGSGEKLPVILNLHGGGLVLCTKEVNRPFCASLASRGFAVFCIDYPLVPDRTVPQILEDVCLGMDRAGALLERFGGDRERVFLVGDSAGAFLAVYAAAAQRDAAIAGAAGVTPPALKIRGLGLISGMFHTAECDETGFFLRKDFYGKDWRRHPLMPYLKPERHSVAALMPPAILVTGRGDKLRRSTLRFYRGLRAAGVECKLLDHPAKKGLGHDFVIMYPEREESSRVLEEMKSFFVQERYIK